MLTPQQCDELEAFGPENVRAKLATQGEGRDASIMGFKCGEITRGDIEDWLAEKNTQEKKMQERILFWAIVGGVSGTVGALIALFK